MKKVQVWGKTFVPFISSQQLDQRITVLANEISTMYKGKTPVIAGVLNGAFMFTSDLVKKLNVPAEVTFVRYASYQGMGSTGNVRELIGFDSSIAGKDLIIVEDIVDTGLTMKTLIEKAQALRPSSIRIAALLLKPEALKTDIHIDFLGFEIANQFVVGYGLDYNGLGREFDEIFVLEK